MLSAIPPDAVDQVELLAPIYTSASAASAIKQMIPWVAQLHFIYTSSSQTNQCCGNSAKAAQKPYWLQDPLLRFEAKGTALSFTL